MKAQSTIRKQIGQLRRISQDVGQSSLTRSQAYEAWHILRWVIEDVYWTPVSLLRDSMKAAKAKR